MGYEVFVKQFTTKSTNPTLTISPWGRCTLNRAAAALFDKEAVENVILLWDKDAYKFAIRPTGKKDNSRSFDVRYSKHKESKQVTGAAFSGVMFLKHVGYDYSKTSTYPLAWNSSESIFEVQLDRERFHGSQQPLIAVEGGRKAHGKAV